jgi:hypothetical protein
LDQIKGWNFSGGGNFPMFALFLLLKLIQQQPLNASAVAQLMNRNFTTTASMSNRRQLEQEAVSIHQSRRNFAEQAASPHSLIHSPELYSSHVAKQLRLAVRRIKRRYDQRLPRVNFKTAARRSVSLRAKHSRSALLRT